MRTGRYRRTGQGKEGNGSRGDRKGVKEKVGRGVEWVVRQGKETVVRVGKEGMGKRTSR